jgi:hypothetical protein
VPGHDAGPPQRDGAGGILGRAAGAAGEVVHLLAGAFEALPQALKRFVEEPSDGPERPCRAGLGRRGRSSRRRLGLSARRFLGTGRRERRKCQGEQHEYGSFTRTRDIGSEPDHDESPSPSIRMMK